MTNEQKQDFTRRITQANRGELVVIKYEILFAYFQDAKDAYGADDRELFKQAVRQASVVLESFEETLDFKYEISSSLYAVYDFHCRQLSKAILHYSLKEVEEAEKMLRQLYEAFKEVAKTDDSKPLMQNAQQVYAGYTYGKNDINETYDTQASRGFLA